MTDYITHNNTQIAYYSTGEGSPLVLLHGFCEDRSILDHFHDELVNAGYRLICIDLPGFGDSGVVEQVTIEQMSEMVNAVVQQLIPTDPFVLIGHSMGGYVTLAYARKFSANLRGIGLFHSHPFADSEEKKANRQKSIEFISVNGHQKFVRQLMPNLFAESFRNSNPAVVEKLIEVGIRQSPAGIIYAQQAMMKRTDQSRVLQEFSKPVLFIIGAQDGAVSWHQSLAQTHLPSISFIKSLEQVGHMGMFEAKAKTQAAIIEFAEYCFATN